MKRNVFNEVIGAAWGAATAMPEPSGPQFNPRATDMEKVWTKVTTGGAEKGRVEGGGAAFVASLLTTAQTCFVTGSGPSDWVGAVGSLVK
jgi:hypothetical protein